jgi:hypothetical protein
MLCLVLESSAKGGELPPFTQQNPGATIDLMAEGKSEATPDRQTAVLLVRGAPWQATERFVAYLSSVHAPVTTLRASPEDGLWFGRVTFREATFHSPVAKAVQALAGMIGPPWVHLEHGVGHLRARIRDPAHAEDLIHLAEESLRAIGVEAQVVAQEVSPRDHSVWEELVQHGIGLRL